MVELIKYNFIMDSKKFRIYMLINIFKKKIKDIKNLRKDYLLEIMPEINI